ncbi:hypothetical protein [Streptomyces beijiangensis]|uniref:Uncharacterized protein n=1 Tax=Streptomyces beijiangensis TaxID=163361 RepID=A0A939JHJ7_9ACTN|nr:hypothetical protein [Streptomyces beijiangensis]MBO0514548.1 hypothetical protein [Streptomyces beijiangensis]
MIIDQLGKHPGERCMDGQRSGRVSRERILPTDGCEKGFGDTELIRGRSRAVSADTKLQGVRDESHGSGSIDYQDAHELRRCRLQGFRPSDPAPRHVEQVPHSERNVAKLGGRQCVKLRVGPQGRGVDATAVPVQYDAGRALDAYPIRRPIAFYDNPNASTAVPAERLGHRSGHPVRLVGSEEGTGPLCIGQQHNRLPALLRDDIQKRIPARSAICSEPEFCEYSCDYFAPGEPATVDEAGVGELPQDPGQEPCLPGPPCAHERQHEPMAPRLGEPFLDTAVRLLRLHAPP